MARSRRRRRGGGEGWTIALGVLAGVVALGVLGGMMYLNATVERPPVLDQATLCPVTGPASITVVLVDASDPLPDVARTQVATALTDLADDLPTHGLLELRLLDPSDPQGRVVFSRCNPGTGDGLSEWTANPEAAKRRWIAEFRDPIRAVLAEGLPQIGGDVSPIMASIQRIAVDRFDGEAMRTRPKRLVIVSDMVENTADYSQYRGDLGFARYASSVAAKTMATDLRGAEVTVYYVQRLSPGLDSAEHIRFWTDWVTANDGRLVEAVKLQGAG